MFCCFCLQRDEQRRFKMLLLSSITSQNSDIYMSLCRMTFLRIFTHWHVLIHTASGVLREEELHLFLFLRLTWGTFVCVCLLHTNMCKQDFSPSMVSPVSLPPQPEDRTLDRSVTDGNGLLSTITRCAQWTLPPPQRARGPIRTEAMEWVHRKALWRRSCFFLMPPLKR